MFEIGFWELVMVAVVALLVVGPERMPKLARTAGLWIGKGRRFVASVRADIEQELRTEELQRILDEQAKHNPLEEILEETKEGVRSLETGTPTAVAKTEAPGAVGDRPAAERSHEAR
jgi:sec-independent protein translocase protein TatB